MVQETILANAELVLEDTVRRGALLIRDGHIVDISEGTSVPTGAVDCEGDYLAPGLVELHTDNLERHLRPRPKVDWPHLAAIVGHDRELACTGVTTVFDAIRVGSILSQNARRFGRYAREVTDQLIGLRAQGALKIDHHIHLRAEICSETLIEELAAFGPADGVGIVSLMDHTPGQRQFRDLSRFEAYVRGKHNLPEEGFQDYIAFLRDLQQEVGAAHQAAALAAAAQMGATLASHDDTTAQQVADSAGQGITLAEFPTTHEAARACRAHGQATIMGAPNLVRGASHSGNVAAQDLAEEGLLDILSSDYVPSALLQGAVQLADLWGDLPRAMATVSRTPARAVGLQDRGEIAHGQRADLLRFARLDGVPLVRAVWVTGSRVS